MEAAKMSARSCEGIVWLGDRRGYLSDWVTQRWVQLTGRRVPLAANPWLAGPVGKTRGIGRAFFHTLVDESGRGELRGDGVRGLLPDFAALAAADFDPGQVHPAVRAFYEQTSTYELDAWSEWCGAFRPFGRLLAILFSRRLQQLNIPLSPLDTSRGITSEVLQLVEPAGSQVLYTAWIRELRGSGRVLYAGAYSVDTVPNRPGPCIKVVFPLPNGNAIVLMRPEVHEDGSVSLVSAGRRFGDPGFYFTVRAGAGEVWARYVASMRERIHVFGSDRDARADHLLTLWGLPFLWLHYRLRRQERPATADQPAPSA